MALTPVEIIAAILAIAIVIKLIFIIFNKKAWYENVAKPIYGNTSRSAFIFVILAIIIFYYIIQELSIVQIFAVIGFSSLLTGLGFVQFSKELTPLIKKAYSQKITGWMWLLSIVFLVLSLWVLSEIFL